MQLDMHGDSSQFRAMNPHIDTKLPSIGELLKRLWRYIPGKRRRQLALLLLLSLVVSCAEVASIGALLPFLGLLVTPENVLATAWGSAAAQFLGTSDVHDLLLAMTLLFAAVSLVAGALRLLLLFVQTRLCYAIGADLGLEIYRKTLYQPYRIHVMRNSSEVIAGISLKAKALVGSMLVPAATLISSALIMVMITASLVWLDPAMAMAAFAGLGGIYLTIVFIFRRQLAQYSKHVSTSQNQIIKALQEGLGGIRDVLIDGTQETYCRVYRQADMPFRRASANIQIISGSPRYAVEALAMVFIAFLAYFSVLHSGGIESVIPVLGTLTLGAQRMLPVLQQAFLAWATMKGGQAAVSDAINLLEQPLPAVTMTDPAQPPLNFKQTIELKGVGFRYDSHKDNVIHQMDLVIERGSRVGIIGATGSGKSTLLDILMGLLTPTAGQMLVDDTPINCNNMRAWQQHIAHVPQSIFLTDASVAENIAFGIAPQAIDMKRVRAAAQQAQIAQNIEGWEKGYDTVIGERGVRLSGGQRQRIGIARALYKEADVLVLDEATSALDNETEGLVMSSLGSLGRPLTVIIVAHRLSTLSSCSQIIELAGGRIVRQGTYETLILGKDAT